MGIGFWLSFWGATVVHVLIASMFFDIARHISAIKSDFINVKIPRLLYIILVYGRYRNGRKTIPLVGIFLYIGILRALYFSVIDLIIRFPNFPHGLDVERLEYLQVWFIPSRTYVIFFIIGAIYAHICEFYCKFRRNNKGEDK